jgi:CBS domain-containing protein
LIGDDPPPPPAPAAPTVAGVMTTDLVVVEPTADAVAVTKVMLDRHLRAVPVVDGTRLVGVLTRRDLLRTIARDDRDIARDVRHRLAVACRQRWEVEVADGVVTLVAEGEDASEQHVAQVVASALPGVLEVRVTDAASTARARTTGSSS